MASGLITSWQTDGEKMETVTDFIFLGSKSLWMVTAAMKSRQLLLGRKVMTDLDSVLKSSHYSADKGWYSQGYSLPSGHVLL